MTDEEALKLKPGDRVEAITMTRPRLCEFVREWVPCLVASVTRRGPVRVVVCPVGRPWNRVRYTNRAVVPRNVRWPCDPLTANVFADHLEEHGFEEAAAFLRRAFPLCDGTPPG